MNCTANTESFIRAKGKRLVDGYDREILIRGIAFGNEVWSNPKLPSKTHHTEESYAQLRDLGFNCIRFYLNYGLFEEDDAPYQYKQSGWDWLSQNVAWANKYGLYLILNMHYPHGGFQSNGNGLALWTDRENQLRLRALWREIALRYRQESVLLAFDLVNEPVVPELASEAETLRQWPGLAAELVQGIREVNDRHLILVERLNASKNPDTGRSNWSPDRNGAMNLFLLKDHNIAYEFHIYEPMDFTHQNARWIESLIGVSNRYPDSMRNQALLKAALKRYLEFSDAQDVPLYLGEFGCIADSFLEDRGGERWVRDMLELCITHKIHFNYHTYHEPAFGLYQNSASELPSCPNLKLMQVFREVLA
jgi:endoglucanase